MARAILATVLGCALIAAVFANDFTSEHVVHLTTSNYEEKMSTPTVFFIKYYAPWCGHCKRLAPAWKELAEELKDTPNVAIAHIDCTVDKEVCTNAGVRGYPTLKVLYKGEEVKAYRGARDKETLKTFILEAAKEVTTEA